MGRAHFKKSGASVKNGLLPDVKRGSAVPYRSSSISGPNLKMISSHA